MIARLSSCSPGRTDRLLPVIAMAAAMAGMAPSTTAQDPPPGGDLEARVRALEAKRADEQKAAADHAKSELTLLWKDGLRIESAAKDFELKIGGRIQFDTLWGANNRDAVSTTGSSLEDGSQARRARLAISGKLYEHVEYKWEYDFSDKDGKTKVTDAYGGLVGLGSFPNIRAGHFREPFGLEALTSANDLTFMERGLPFALVPFRNLGAQLSKAFAEERMTATAGVFREANDQAFGQADGAYAVTARVTGLPWYAEQGKRLVHLGVSASRRAPPSDEVQFKSKPEANLAPDLIDTKKLTNVNDVTLLGAEAALLWNAFSLQGEWVHADLQRDGGMSDASFCGWYALATWTITGEPRRYRLAEAAFQSPKPAANAFDGKGGLGALELAARLSTLDLDDGPIKGGELTDYTLGLNWYPYPVMRVSLNGIRAVVDRAPAGGNASILEMRFQVAF